jgi:TatD DNase family protein
MFNFHTHISQKNAIINIDDLSSIVIKEELYYSIGIHPWYNQLTINNVDNAINTYNRIIAIGECGIDKIKSPLDLDKQIEILKQQIKLSEKYQLPIILHIVKGFNEVIKLKKELKPKQPWVIHWFNNYKQTQTLINNGFYLSFGKSLINNVKIQDVFKNIPIEKVFFETDDDAIEIEKIYTFASELKKIELGNLIQQINNNLTTVFNGKLVRAS